MAFEKTATMASILISVLSIIISVLKKTATRTQLVIDGLTITMWRPEIIVSSSQLVMWKPKLIVSGAEIIISRTELIIGEAEITVSKAKVIISEQDLIIGVTNKIISAPLCSRSILARMSIALPRCVLHHLQSTLGWPPFSGFFLKRRGGVMTRNGAAGGASFAESALSFILSDYIELFQQFTQNAEFREKLTSFVLTRII